jgi:hypothetical protein
MTRAEQETTVRWDEEGRRAYLCTAHAGTATKWRRLGYRVQVLGLTRGGEARSWQTDLPLNAIRFRALGSDGAVKKQSPRGAAAARVAEKRLSGEGGGHGNPGE